MRVLQVTPYFPPAWPYGGPPRVVYYLSKALVSMGHEVIVYTTDAQGPKQRCPIARESLEGIEVVRFRNLSNYLAWRHQLFISPSMARPLAHRLPEVDIVHFHTYRTYQNVIGFKQAEQNGIPIVLTPHGTLGRISRKRALKALFDAEFGRRMLSSLALAVALSEDEATSLRECGLDASRIRIIPNGVDASPYETLPPPGAFKARHGLDGKRLVTYVGRLHKTKGLKHLVRAFSELKKRLSDLHLVLVGPDEGYQPTLKRLCHELGLGTSVHFIGFVDFPSKPSAFVDSEVVVYPTSNEVFGLVPLESVLCMTPVVVSEDAGCASFIRELGVGRTVPYGDAAALSRCIESVLEDRVNQQSVLARGREFILSQLTWKAVAQRTASAYEDCLIRAGRTMTSATAKSH